MLGASQKISGASSGTPATWYGAFAASLATATRLSTGSATFSVNA